MMNASQRLFLALLLSLEIVLTNSLSFNVILLLFFNGLNILEGLLESWHKVQCRNQSVDKGIR